jgi:hypothetical protein
MKPKSTSWTALATAIFVGGLMANSASAQNSDSLLNILIKKGVLTEQEAKDIKAEAAQQNQKDFNQNFAAKTGMPSWIKSYRLYGDFRGRFEENNAENVGYHTRDRFRFRLRTGLEIAMEKFDVGMRLASGNPQLNQANLLVGGQSITANQDLNSLESRKGIWIDAAYARYTPVKNDDWIVSASIGKIDNPFQLSNMVWDYDINPEGAGLQITHALSDQHAIKGIGGIFVLDEFNQSSPTPYIISGTNIVASPGIRASHDPYLFGGQALWEAKWTPQIDTSLGVAAFDIVHAQDSLSAKVQPFYNAGNTRNANGFLVHHYDPLIGSASVVYKFPAFPLYEGQFPIRLSGEYMRNPSAPNDQNAGYRAGITIGKAGKKHTWEINYRYQRLEADAWYDALVDDDNGAFYPGNAANPAPQLSGTGKNNGWFGGTNVKGHQVIATYSFTDFLNFTFVYYRNDAIIKSFALADNRSDAGHFYADLNWKF